MIFYKGRNLNYSFNTVELCISQHLTHTLCLQLLIIGSNGSRYAHYTNQVNWTTARDMCQTFNFGNLTSINSQAQQEYFFHNFRGDKRAVWIGLNTLKVCKDSILVEIALVVFSLFGSIPSTPSKILFVSQF